LVHNFCTGRTKDATWIPEMDRQATRNAWRLFNLRESPFFQEPLQAGTRYPMSLFVGRATDTDRLLNKITRSPGSSRQTVRLENLTEANAERAAALLSDIRDLCFMVDGFHWLIVGTEDAVRTVIDAQPQLATVFSTPPALAPLTESELLKNGT
jgi:hypothetical protein